MIANGEALRVKLKEKLDQLPDKPGIYQMLDAWGNVIYIGKSKCLKRRVKSYFVPEPKWDKVKKMLPYIEDFQYIVTDTHLEARLEECVRIKSIRPKFNVMMKDDHLYVYLKLRAYNTSNPLGVTYTREDDTYGIYRSRSRLEEAILDIRKLYPIEKIKGSYTAREHLFPEHMDRAVYAENRRALKELLEHPRLLEQLICGMDRQMKAAASEYRFETAAKYKEHKASLLYIQKGLSAYADSIKKSWLLKIPLDMGIKLFYIEKGFVICSRVCRESSEEIEKAFLQEAVQRARQRKEELDKRCLEKGCGDYREIVFTEIMSLPPEHVKEINPEDAGAA